jgi:hypothetical protein
MTSAAGIAAARDRSLAALDFARQCTRRLLEDFPTEMAAYQLAGEGPHALWILGHLAVSDEWIEGMIAPFESRLPKSYKMHFGHQSTPHRDADAYPLFHEVIAHFEASRKQLISAVHSATDDQLLRQLGDEGVGFANDPLDAVTKTAWHEGWHAGQLSRIRLSLGLPGIFPD